MPTDGRFDTAAITFNLRFDQSSFNIRFLRSGSTTFRLRSRLGAGPAKSTLRRLALLADRAACFEFLDLIGRERNRARPDQVDGDLADAVGRIDRELVERFDVAGDGDDETVHHVFDAIGLLVDRLRHALQERLDLGKVEVRVLLDGDHAAVSLPAGRGDGFVLGFDPLQGHLSTMRARGRHPRDRVFGDPVAGGAFDPLLQVLLGHLRVVRDQSGEVHRVGDAGVVEIQSELVVHLDAFLDLLHVLDLDAEARLLGAVVHPGFLGLCVAELLEFGDDVFGGHLLSPSSCMA